MKNVFILFLFAIVITGCEVFVIKGTKFSREPVVDLTQHTPLGVMYLFKAELDSNNLYGALSVIAAPGGKKFLAIERYERKEDIARIKRHISHRKITDIKTDTLANDTINFNLEFDWTKKMQFTASKISNYWYITNYKFSNSTDGF